MHTSREAESRTPGDRSAAAVAQASTRSFSEAKRSFLFLSANTPWVLALADALATRHDVHGVQFYDWRTYRRWSGWPAPARRSAMRKTLRVMPPGYAGRAELLFRPILRKWIQSWAKGLQRSSGSDPWIITPYPYLAPWVSGVSRRLIYFNLDDYTLYQPSRSGRITDLENELIEDAALTLCLSHHQTERLRTRHEHRANHIKHFPLGVTPDAVNPAPNKHMRANTVGYIGNLSDRVDWRFASEVASGCPNLTFVFVGDLDKYNAPNSEWKREREKTLNLPNVQLVGPVPQDKVRQYHWSFGVNWIPYSVDHPFNKASCPTKIMDGLAAGRPLVSTAVPECTLYPDWISIAYSPEDAAKAIQRWAKNHSYERADQQIEFVRRNTWSDRALLLEAWLSDREDLLNRAPSSQPPIRS